MTGRRLSRSDERAPVHSITSSARASTVGGTSRPSALAVLRLMSNSYLVGAWAVVTETTDPTQPGVAFRCSSELEAKGTEFYGRTAPLIATKEPPSSTNQPGHRTPPSCRAISLCRGNGSFDVRQRAGFGRCNLGQRFLHRRVHWRESTDCVGANARGKSAGGMI
jgi:hypothetical protein